MEPWNTLLAAWMHDPLDKAASIAGHQVRAACYASIYLGRDVSAVELRSEADQLASAYERLPMPRADECAVDPEDGQLLIVHPLSAEKRKIRVKLDEHAIQTLLRSLAPGAMDAKRRFLSLWRLAPESVPEGLRLQPAETRCPDHTLWHHLDTTAAAAWAMKRGGAALLSFKLGPVQPFIEAARSLRDLLTGSYLISSLAWAAIVPVIESCGPTALIYPALRGVPLADLWLHEQGVPVARPSPEKLGRPSIPHRFLALVPADLAEDLIGKTRRAALDKWREIAEAVHHKLKRQLDSEWLGWDRLWDRQIESYFDARAVAFAVQDFDPERLLGQQALRQFNAISLLGHTGGAPAGLWQALVEYSATLMEASTQIRYIPVYRAEGDVPQKCTLLGSYEQMGPARLSHSRHFFEEGLNFEKGTDRLCAVSLVKRFAFHHYFRPLLGVDPERFPDTQTLARRAGDEFIYYALLAMDGDQMGGWLSGAKSPRIREVLHPKLVEWHQRDPGRSKALDLPRPVSPALHAAISEALNRFAVRVAPEIVEEHNGVVIYSGGDDLVAALPLDTALLCALELRRAFSRFDVMGARATISAGMALTHYKYNLREALRAARKALQASKQAGRDRFTLAVLRRGGEHTQAGCPWPYLPVLERQRESFAGGSSDRWTYQLRRELPVLGALPVEAFQGELARLLKRSEKRDERFLQDFSRYAELESNAEASRLIESFLLLAQAASFMARGKEAGS